MIVKDIDQNYLSNRRKYRQVNLHEIMILFFFEDIWYASKQCHQIFINLDLKKRFIYGKSNLGFS